MRLPQGSRKSRNGPSEQFAAGFLDEPGDGAAVVHHDAEVAGTVAVLPRIRLCQVDELVAHVDESLTLSLAAQREVEDAAVEGECLLDVADFEGEWFMPTSLGLVHGVAPLAGAAVRWLRRSWYCPGAITASGIASLRPQ